MSAEQVNFLLACIKHNSAGAKIDFEAVAAELNIPSKAAAAKRYERLKKKAQASNFADLSASATTGDDNADGQVGTPQAKAPRTPRTPRGRKTIKVEDGLAVQTPADASTKRKHATGDAPADDGAPTMVFAPIDGPAPVPAANMDDDASTGLDNSKVKRVKTEQDPDGTVAGEDGKRVKTEQDPDGTVAGEDGKRVKTEQDPDDTVAGEAVTKETWLKMMLAGSKEDHSEDGV